MDSVSQATSSPRAALSTGGDESPPCIPTNQAAPVLSQPQADDGIRRFFHAAAGGPPAQSGAQPAVLSQAWSALPPDKQE
jgi:hypothetical protein